MLPRMKHIQPVNSILTVEKVSIYQSSSFCKFLFFVVLTTLFFGKQGFISISSDAQVLDML